MIITVKIDHRTRRVKMPDGFRRIDSGTTKVGDMSLTGFDADNNAEWYPIPPKELVSKYKCVIRPKKR